MHLLKSEPAASSSADEVDPSRYLPLTPKARVSPTSSIKALNETSTTAPTPAGVNAASSNSDNASNEDTAEWPPRVPNLHYQVLHGVNPTLAFSGLPVSNTVSAAPFQSLRQGSVPRKCLIGSIFGPYTSSLQPFVLADLQMRYVRGVWDGSIPLAASRPERTADEAARVRVLEARRPQYASLDASLREDWEKGRAHGLAEALRLAAPPSFGQPLYHMLPGLHTDELEYAQHLREQVIRAKPWLDALLDKWDSARDAARQGMYNVKFVSLVRAKLALLDASQGGGESRL